jgi:hypothetical protein
MTATTAELKTEWRIVGEDIGLCNCAWGCPCQFNALPTYGSCEALAMMAIEEGHFGDTPLDGVRYVQVFHWDGPVHEGNGQRRLIVDDRASPAQRAAIEALTSGSAGHAVFEIFSAMAPNALETVVARIDLEYDHERRRARVRIPDLAEGTVEPIRNPVTGEESQARIDLPEGFEYRVAEMANAVSWRTTAGEHLDMAHENSYAQMARVEWRSDGSVR